MKRTCSLVLTVTLLAVSPLAVSQDEGEEIADEEEAVCINTNMVRSFDAFNDNYVYVRQGANQHFLLTMRNRCTGLRYAQGIAFKDTTSRICSDRFGEIVYRDRSMARGLQSCRIGKIERVESRDEAKALVEGLSDQNRGMDEAEEEAEDPR
mgnify:FL=1|jgi:hypothetical protein